MSGATVKSLTISSHDYLAALDTLESGKFFQIKINKNSGEQRQVLLRRAGLLDRFCAYWFTSRAERETRAKQLANHVRTVLGLPDRHWLLGKIEDKVQADGLIDGKFLAKHLKVFKGDCQIYGGTIHARKSNGGIGLVNAAPEKVHADEQVMSFDVAKSECEKSRDAYYDSLDQYAAGENQSKVEIYNRNFLKDGNDGCGWQGAFASVSQSTSASDSVVAMPPLDEFQKRGIETPEKFFRALGQYASGAIVMSPLSDNHFMKSAGESPASTKPVFSDDNLKEQLWFAYQINSEAAQQDKSVVITFATEDRSLFRRLEQLNIEVRKEFEQAGK